MFDIGASELLLIVVVAVVVIGPKDLPLAMRTAGRWIASVTCTPSSALTWFAMLTTASKNPAANGSARASAWIGNT